MDFSLWPALAAGLLTIPFVLWLLRKLLEDFDWSEGPILLAATVVLLVLGGFGMYEPFRCGDELVNFSAGLFGAVSGLDLEEYPHPALYFNLTAGVYAWVIALSETVSESVVRVVPPALSDARHPMPDA